MRRDMSAFTKESKKMSKLEMVETNPCALMGSKDESIDALSEESVDSGDRGQPSVCAVVHDVIRNIHLERASVLASAGDSSRINCVDACIASVLRSISNEHGAGPIATASDICTVNTRATVQAEDNGDQLIDDIEPPPKLFAVHDSLPDFDQYRYRKRRKRIFSHRRPVKRRPRLNIDQSTVSLRRRSGRVFDRQSTERKQRLQNNAISPDHVCHMKRKMATCTNRSKVSIPLCWQASLNEKLLPTLDKMMNDQPPHVTKWSVDRVSEFVRALPSCPPWVADKFRVEQIDGEAFLLLTQHDIVSLMNIRLGPAVKIYNAIMFLKHKTLNGRK